MLFLINLEQKQKCSILKKWLLIKALSWFGASVKLYARTILTLC